MKYYCLTIKKCVPSKTISNVKTAMKVYDGYLRYIKSLSESTNIEYHYEYVPKKNGSYNVHFHAMIKTDQKIFLKGKKGYSINLSETRSKAAWQKYITKNPYTAQQMLDLISSLIQPKNTHIYHVGPCQEGVSPERSSASQESLSISDEQASNIDWSKRQIPKTNNSETSEELSDTIIDTI